jgi:photosystem II stability/assembly factor-like uncharacterized protein
MSVKHDWMKNVRMKKIAFIALFLGLVFGPGSAQRPAGTAGAQPEALKFRFLGPAVGNRISAAAGIPGNPNTYYVGAAAGGVWKSVNGGTSWVPISDDQIPVGAIGSLAVAASNPDIVWAGTGDSWPIRDADVMGDGIYKSVDAGKTWTHMGLTETARIGRIIIHPANPNIVYAAALGRLTGPQEERGVFRTTDGGKTWTRVLFVDPNTGCSGLAMDPNNPQVLFAGMWQAEMHTWAMFSGGPSSGVFMSRDGGTTWKRLEGRGLPKPPVGKIDVAVAARNSKRVYALIQTADQGSIWRSDDGGESWRVMSWQRALIGRAGFYIRLAISPSNPDEVLVANSSFHISADGGKSFRSMGWGGDNHDIWIDPKNADRILVTNDGGMFMTLDHGKTSNRVTLPIAQLYHFATDNDVPYRVYTNMQDNGTMRGLSTTPESGPNVPAAAPAGGGFGGGRQAAGGVWDHGLGGCESGFTIPDPTDSNIVWSSCYGFELTRYDFRTKLARSVSPVQHTLDSEPNKLKYRAHWTPPIAIDPFDHNTVYFGAQVIFRTTNAGRSWSVISPDLSTQDPRYIVSSGGIVGDNLGQFYGEVIFAIAPSPVKKGLIWAGTNDGKVWLTKNGGGKWIDVTRNIQGVPAWGTISKIDASAVDAATAYIAVDLHLMDNRDPWVFKTADYGATWTNITGDLPHGHPLDYIRVVTENPNRKGMLFAGSGRALYYSMNDGQSWKRLKDGLPPAPISWVIVQKQTHDLAVSTYGRGIYIMEDITPLEQGFKEGGPASDPKLAEPRPAYRLVRGGSALFHYALPAAPKDPVQLEILDASGTVIRKLAAAQARAGLNRFSWDLRHEPPRPVGLRTTPPRNPHVWEEPRFQNATTRPITHWGIAQAQVGPIAVPGSYSARMTVDGQVLTQPLVLLLPPGNTGTEADIRSSVKLQLRVRDDLNIVSDMTNQIEWLRRQLEDARKPLAAQPGREAPVKAIDDFEAKMLAVEDLLISRSEALSDDKYYQEAYKLYLNLIWLSGEIGTGAGDVAGSADFGPTDTATTLVANLERELDAAQEAYRVLIDKDVPAFNKANEGSGIPALKMTGAPAPTVMQFPGR